MLPFILLRQAPVGGAMGDEPGWRGYALPRPRDRWGARGASVVLGPVWGLWRLPLAILSHTAIAVTRLLVTPSGAHPLVGVALSWAAAALVTAWAGPWRLGRGRGAERLEALA